MSGILGSMLDPLLRGIAIGALVSVAVAAMRTRPFNTGAMACLLLCVATSGTILQFSPALFAQIGPLQWPAKLFAAGGTAYFWLFAMALFGSGRLTGVHALPPVAMTAIALFAELVTPPGKLAIGIVHNLLEIALIAHVLIAIWRGRSDDLVDSRLALRTPFMVLAALLSVALSDLEMAKMLGLAGDWVLEAGALALAFVSLAGAFTFLQTRRELFAAPGSRRGAGRSEAAQLSAADGEILDRLHALMAGSEFWRRSGLGIAQTAQEVGAPEHRLRQLINRHLGYRNFSDFLNERRIAMAKAELRDPAKALVQISTIAFDLGYASLGPFNRAFREATGMTPREWREAPAAS